MVFRSVIINLIASHQGDWGDWVSIALQCKELLAQCRLTYLDYQLQCSISPRIVSEPHGDRKEEKQSSQL